MAAILQPHRHPLPAEPARPELRVLPGGRTGAARPVAGPSTASLVVLALLLVVVVVGVLALGRGAFAGLAPAPAAASGPAVAAAPAPAAAASGTSIVVRPGDSLWSIARRIQPTGDVRGLVDELAAANGSTAIRAGDRLTIPG